MKTSHDPTLPNRFPKLTLTLLVLTSAMLFCGSTRLAADEAAIKAAPKGANTRVAAKRSKAAEAKAAQPVPSTAKKVVLTGTRIPREPMGASNTYIVGSPVHVIERSEIERSGAMTTAGVLRRLPFVR